MTTRNLVAIILQPVGAAAIAAGVGLVYVPAGIICAGIEAVLFGLSLELAGRPPKAPEMSPDAG